jgi:hypothetical protein
MDDTVRQMQLFGQGNLLILLVRQQIRRAASVSVDPNVRQTSADDDSLFDVLRIVQVAAPYFGMSLL